MDSALIKLSIERLLEKVERLEKENSELKQRIEAVENKAPLEQKENTVIEIVQEREDVLIDTKEVLQILGISYNTLRAIIRRKLILPIRINQRRVRYSKKAIREFIESRKTIRVE